MRTRGPSLACALIAGAIAAPSAQEPAVSVNRVRAALERPASSVLVIRKPDFFVHIEERHPLQEIFDKPPWLLPKPGWQPPGVGFDLLGVFRSIAKGTAEEKHRRDTLAAQDDVQRALAEYCAAQPNAGAAIQICSSVPAIR